MPFEWFVALRFLREGRMQTVLILLGVSVVQKNREIGILRAVGTTRRQVLHIFLIQGLLLGAGGWVLGVGIGAALSLLFAGHGDQPGRLANLSGQSLAAALPRHSGHGAGGGPPLRGGPGAAGGRAGPGAGDPAWLSVRLRPTTPGAAREPGLSGSGPAGRPVVLLERVTKDFGEAVVTHVLKEIDFRLERREFTALIGPSGSGKCTLLNLIGLLDRPTCGSHRVRRHRHARPARDRPHSPARPLHRVRLPVPPPAAGLHRAGERHAAGDRPGWPRP